MIVVSCVVCECCVCMFVVCDVSVMCELHVYDLCVMS